MTKKFKDVHSGFGFVYAGRQYIKLSNTSKKNTKRIKDGETVTFCKDTPVAPRSTIKDPQQKLPLGQESKNPNQITVEPRFGVGDDMHEVYFDDDIGAYNVCSVRVHRVVITISEDPYSDGTVSLCEYVTDPGFSDVTIPESEDLFETSYAACQEAKSRNEGGLPSIRAAVAEIENDPDKVFAVHGDGSIEEFDRAFNEDL
jgi:hypothetical protein